MPGPEGLPGTTLRPQLENPVSPGRVAISYNARAKTIRTVTHRLIVHRDGFTELYDHTSQAGETRNVAAAHPQRVENLRVQLTRRLGR